jgi:hypothetical protein
VRARCGDWGGKETDGGWSGSTEAALQQPGEVVRTRLREARLRRKRRVPDRARGESTAKSQCLQHVWMWVLWDASEQIDGFQDTSIGVTQGEKDQDSGMASRMRARDPFSVTSELRVLLADPSQQWSTERTAENRGTSF